MRRNVSHITPEIPWARSSRWRRVNCFAIYNGGRLLPHSTGYFSTFFSNHGHMLAVASDRLAAFTSGRLGFNSGKTVSGPFLMCGPAALARQFALTIGVHGGKSAS
jgi:hypothetical protein